MSALRPSFTVQVSNADPVLAKDETKDISYDANVLQVVLLPGDGTGYGIAFMCSGSMMVVPVARVRDVRFAVAHASWCPFCEQPLH